MPKRSSLQEAWGGSLGAAEHPEARSIAGELSICRSWVSELHVSGCRGLCHSHYRLFRGRAASAATWFRPPSENALLGCSVRCRVPPPLSCALH